MIHLLATDMDGTFLRDDKSYSEEFNDLYKQMLKQGIQFVIVSGNQYEALACKFDEEIKNDGKLLHYTKVILSGILDQIFVIGLALVLFGVFDLALRAFGYRVALREEVFGIIYVISNILYYPILQEILHGKTLGKKFIFR